MKKQQDENKQKLERIHQVYDNLILLLYIARIRLINTRNTI